MEAGALFARKPEERPGTSRRNSRFLALEKFISTAALRCDSITSTESIVCRLRPWFPGAEFRPLQRCRGSRIEIRPAPSAPSFSTTIQGEAVSIRQRVFLESCSARSPRSHGALPDRPMKFNAALGVPAATSPIRNFCGQTGHRSNREASRCWCLPLGGFLRRKAGCFSRFPGMHEQHFAAFRLLRTALEFLETVESESSSKTSGARGAELREGPRQVRRQI